jgi:internalin A
MEALINKSSGDREDRALALAERVGERDEERIEGAALRALRKLLDEKDPARQWGGLKKVLTPEGHYLWLCEQHAQEYKI